MQFVQRDYWDFSCKCHLQLKINHKDRLQNDHFLLVTIAICTTHKLLPNIVAFVTSCTIYLHVTNFQGAKTHVHNFVSLEKIKKKLTKYVSNNLHESPHFFYSQTPNKKRFLFFFPSSSNISSKLTHIQQDTMMGEGKSSQGFHPLPNYIHSYFLYFS